VSAAVGRECCYPTGHGIGFHNVGVSYTICGLAECVACPNDGLYYWLMVGWITTVLQQEDFYWLTNRVKQHKGLAFFLVRIN
jgi:hypothetical protein